MQNWYKNEMNRNGFGQKTFGLLISEYDSDYVKVIVVKGKYDSFTYPYEGGGGKAGLEIQEYFNQHPEEESSEHTLTFMPSTRGEHGWDAGGPPFYALGKWTYVLDYKYFDMNVWRDGSKEGDFNWIGGTIHELGHCLNLPHNQHTFNDSWTSMMSWGNHEYNKSPNNVHLTKASAVILNNCEVFNEEEGKVFYNQIPSHTIKSLKIYSNESKLHIKSKFDAFIPVNAVIAYADPKTSSGDANYNAISWATNNIINGDSISIEMPLSDINPDYKQYSFELRMRFCHTNGNFSFESFQFEIENNKPTIDIDFKEIAELDKSQWSIVDFSSEETSGEGANNGHALHMIDGKTNTFWQSKWVGSSPGYPHHVTIDLKELETIKGLTFVHRANKYNGRPKSITILLSNDGVVFNSIGDFALQDSSLKQYVELSEEKVSRYFKIIIN